MKGLFTFLAVISVSLFGISCKGGVAKSDESNALAYQGNFHEEIIKPQVKAWQEVTQVMYPRVCDDTVTQLAAAVADSLGNALLNQPNLSNGEQLVKLYEMENMIAYGMTYFSAIIGAHSNPESSEAALSIVRYSHEDMDTVRAVGFDNPKAVVAYELSTFQNFGLFMELGTQYADGEPQFVTSNLRMQQRNSAFAHFFFSRLNDETQAYRYSVIVNNTSFFMTFCPLCFWLAGQDFQESHQEEFITIGTWFDEKMRPLNNTHSEEELLASLRNIDIETYSADLKQAAVYKAQLIHLLHDGILAMPVDK